MLLPRLFSMLLLPAALFAAGCTSAPSPASCQAFRTGQFSYRSPSEAALGSYQITRTDSLQTEVDPATGRRSVLAVTWLNECTYQLRLVSSTYSFPDSIQRLRRAARLTTEILHTTDRYYVFRAQMRPTDFVLVDTIWVAPQ